MKKLPVVCPSCESLLRVKTLCCAQCDTTVNGFFVLPVLAQLKPDEQSFILAFIKASGSLKEMSALLDLSYPTVRNMLDDLIVRLNQLENGPIQ